MKINLEALSAVKKSDKIFRYRESSIRYSFCYERTLHEIIVIIAFFCYSIPLSLASTTA